MSALVLPTVAVHASFLTAMAEFRAEGRGGADDDSMLGAENRTWAASWADPDVFAEYVAALQADALEDTPRTPGYVPSTTLWWVDGTEYLGRLNIRHRLTPRLRELGGHIGYDVRRRRAAAGTPRRCCAPPCRCAGRWASSARW